jgi:hypothetical protein
MKKHRHLVLASAALVAALVTGVLLASSGGASPLKGSQKADVGGLAAAAARALGTDAVVSARADGSTLAVRLKQSGQPAQASVARWYGKVVARAVAAQLGGTISSASYDDGSAVDLNGGADAIRPLPAASPLAAGTCEQIARSQAAAAGVTAVGRTADVLGGACILVVRPVRDVSTFLADASARIGTLVAAIPNAQAHPYLVEAMSGANVQLVLGWIPGIGGSAGQGIGWLPQGTTSSAVLGSAPGIVAHAGS